MQNDVVLTMRGICKSFPGTRALHNVDFTLRKGEIHALMGENGAGKSTLIKVLTGVYEKDSGSITVDGKDAHIRSPQDAQNAGISTVYQEITLCPNLTVAENMFIGRSEGNLIHWKEREKRTAEILANLGIPARPKQELSGCSLAVQQMVAIARAVDMQCKVLILDEPTSSLDEKEVEMLFGLMRDLKSRGVGIIFVTHFLEQVYAVSDRITVLRNGELVGEYERPGRPGTGRHEERRRREHRLRSGEAFQHGEPPVRFPYPQGRGERIHRPAGIRTERKRSRDLRRRPGDRRHREDGRKGREGFETA